MTSRRLIITPKWTVECGAMNDGGLFLVRKQPQRREERGGAEEEMYLTRRRGGAKCLFFATSRRVQEFTSYKDLTRKFEIAHDS